MSATLTRQQFEKACKAYINEYHNNSGLLALGGYPRGWAWKEYASMSCIGYMSRSVLFPHKFAEDYWREHGQGLDAELDVIDDSTSAASNIPDVLTWNQYVAYSASYQVPAFYFTIHQSNGVPLPLTEILKTPLFRPQSLPETITASFGLSDPESSFALLSQGDHPVLGTPSWYLHPCHTSEAVKEIMTEVQRDNWTEEERLLRKSVKVLNNQ
ncbi:hypothetical protein AcW1_004257 [Taiwanofungus camphoratus]|nr:hypothetical protein AcW2_006732 [Antrodia cinnamomea]KAI0939141.1 hypothetical protein AcV5_000638 [Antrodia cinnamomea]KAI0952058.1 hypothetical protein AcV7_007980 [Antrodia cinnamomea]KAI0959434.1 hypothetical protein AcW1_004257 [Antrodia cinnamomea]